jgi:hypothetical protein
VTPFGTGFRLFGTVTICVACEFVGGGLVSSVVGRGAKEM